MHRLKIFAFVPVGNRGVKAAHFRGERVHALPAPRDGGPEFFPVLDKEKGVIGQPSHNAVRTVDNEPAARALQLPEETSVRMRFKVIILERSDYMLVRLDPQPKAVNRIVGDMSENLGVGLIPHIAGEAARRQILTDRDERRVFPVGHRSYALDEKRMAGVKDDTE